MGELLAALVGDVDRFAAEAWGRRCWRHAADPSAAHGLLTVADVERLVGSGLRQPAYRLVQDGKPLPPSASARRVQLGGRPLDDLADPALVHELVAGGATLVLQGLQRTWPAVAAACAALAEALGHPVQANAYLTPAGAAGLGWHADDHDVLTVQLDGEKRWEAREPGAPEGAPLAVEGAVQPGDVLYLPRGARHRARAQAAPSLHLTFGVHARTWRQVVEGLLRDAPGLDAVLPIRPATSPRLVDEAARALGHLATWATGLDPAQVADAEAARPPRGLTAAPPARPLREALAGPQLDAATLLRRREVAAEVEVDGDRARLLLGDRAIALPAAFAPVLEHVAAADELVAGALPRLDEAGSLVLSRRLVRAGLFERA